MANPPTVAILMTTYNGAVHLRAQLDSFIAQSYPHWVLYVSDDGSTDATGEILESYRAQLGEGRVQLLRGPGKGFAANFLSLACREELAADYYMFSDQDDVCLPEKLARAVEALAAVPRETPALYGTRTILTDSEGVETGLSPLFTRCPGFGNALVQCVAGGNTMVFNETARQLLREAGADVPVIGHDWWLYQLVSGCGGTVIYDAVPTLRYRQHAKNLMGGNVSLLAKLLRIRLLFEGRFRDWNDRNMVAWQRMQHRLAPECRAQFTRFAAARNRWLLPRLWGLARAGIYRQTLLGNCGLFAAAFMKKL